MVVNIEHFFLSRVTIYNAKIQNQSILPDMMKLIVISIVIRHDEARSLIAKIWG